MLEQAKKEAMLEINRRVRRGELPNSVDEGARPPLAQEEEKEEEEEAPSSYLFSAFAAALDFFCGVTSSYPLCVGYWLLKHSANSVLDCAFLLVFGVKVATFIWTPAGVRRHCSPGGTQHVTVLCSSSGRRLPCCGAEANPHGLTDSPVAAHLVVDVPVVQLQPVSQAVACPSVCNDRCRVDSECRILWKFRSCRSLKFFNIPVVAQRPFPMVQTALRTWVSTVAPGQGGRCPYHAGRAGRQNPRPGAEAVIWSWRP